MKTTRILLADDHPVVRRGLRAILESHPGWEVIGETSNGREAVNEARQLRPDVVVMDISMPGLNGLEATRQIRKILPKVRILILTVHDSENLVREVLEAGAHGYVLKTDLDNDLLSAVDHLTHGKRYFTAQVSEMLLRGYLGNKPSARGNGTAPNDLTPREREVVQLLAEGKRTKEVAVVLGISVRTAETHRATIMRKLGLHSITELVHFALRNKMVNILDR